MRIVMSMVIYLLVSAALVFAAQDRIRLIGIHDPVTPVTARFVHRHLEAAAHQGIGWC